MLAAADLDCLTCGACCRQGSDGRILVPVEDIVRWKRENQVHILSQLVPGHFGEQAFASTPDGACVHLGTQANPNACRIYSERGTTCREFERGSWQCHEFRRDAGIDFAPAQNGADAAPPSQDAIWSRPRTVST